MKSEEKRSHPAILPEADPMGCTAPLPSGTVTFLFTDIEGSTRLWDQQPETMHAALAEHDTLLRRTIQSHSGRVFKTVGDSLYAVFAQAGDAVQAASAAQAALQKVATLVGHREPATIVAFAPDGSLLASGSADTTIRLWRTAPFTETDPLRINLITSSDRAVALQWRPVPYAQGYQIYRDTPAGGKGERRFVRLTTAPIPGPSFTDRNADLVNGVSRTYAVAPVYQGAHRQLREGPRQLCRAAPVTVPPGLIGWSIQEELASGSAAFDPATGKIVLRGAGRDIWGEGDRCYFLARPMTGDFQVQVRCLTAPGLPATDAPMSRREHGGSLPVHHWAKTGLMVRDSLEAEARHLSLLVTPQHGAIIHRRLATGEATEFKEFLSRSALRLPMELRVTRRGDMLTAEHSSDRGRTFHPVDEPWRSSTPLPSTLYVGLAIASHHSSEVAEARFERLKLLQP